MPSRSNRNVDKKVTRKVRRSRTKKNVKGTKGIKGVKDIKDINPKTQYVFTEDDYNNDNGMLTSVWGPSFWHVLHTISVNYPVNPTDEDKRHYKDFICSLRYVLPCKWCRINLTNNLKLLPLNATALKNRRNLSKWMYDLHELINKNLKKKSGLKFRDIQDRYEHFRARCYHKQPTQSGGGNTIEKGCIDSVYGIKAKCQLHIVPQSFKGESLLINNKCLGKKH